MIRLTKNIKAVILVQFKRGDTIAYLAELYDVSPERIEIVLREGLVACAEEIKAALEKAKQEELK